MYGRGYIAPDPLPPPPVKAMVPALVVPEPRLLDWTWLERALYCTSPTGLRQLADHLRRRDVTFTGEQLQRELHTAMQAGKVVYRDEPFGGSVVRLYALPGYGVGG